MKRLFTSSTISKFTLPFGAEDWQALGRVYVEHQSMPRYLGLATAVGTAIGSALVAIDQWGTSIQLNVLKMEMKMESSKMQQKQVHMSAEMAHMNAEMTKIRAEIKNEFVVLLQKLEKT